MSNCKLDIGITSLRDLLTISLPGSIHTTQCLRQAVGFDNFSIFTRRLTWLFAVLLWFDFALTFPTEVRHIWRRKLSGAMLVYIFTRYTAIIDRVLLISEVFLPNSDLRVSIILI